MLPKAHAQRALAIYDPDTSSLPQKTKWAIDFRGGRGGQTGQGYYIVIIYIRLFAFLYSYSGN